MELKVSMWETEFFLIIMYLATNAIFVEMEVKPCVLTIEPAISTLEDSQNISGCLLGT
jgi:hypothetical protein